jgi:hypothetical protein
MILCIIFLIYISSCSSFFIKYPFGRRFSIKDSEITRKIKYALPIEQQNIINKINGFYGLIGPARKTEPLKMRLHPQQLKSWSFITFHIWFFSS